MVVFDTKEAFALLGKPHLFDYLDLPLVLFVKIEISTLNMANKHRRTRLLRCDTLELNSLSRW